MFRDSSSDGTRTRDLVYSESSFPTITEGLYLNSTLKGPFYKRPHASAANVMVCLDQKELSLRNFWTQVVC